MINQDKPKLKVGVVASFPTFATQKAAFEELKWIYLHGFKWWTSNAEHVNAHGTHGTCGVLRWKKTGQ